MWYLGKKIAPLYKNVLFYLFIFASSGITKCIFNVELKYFEAMKYFDCETKTEEQQAFKQALDILSLFSQYANQATHAFKKINMFKMFLMRWLVLVHLT